MLLKLRFTLLSIGLVTASLTLAAADNAGTSSAQTVVAEIDGAKITLGDLEQKHASALFQARTSYYDLQRKVIQTYIDDYLLEQQAKKEGLTVTALLEKHVNSKIDQDPSEEALRLFYEGIETTDPYEVVRGKILDTLRQRRTAKAKSEYMQSLRSQSTLILRLPPPRAAISMKDVPVRGDAKAPLTLVEFADYECPYCQQIHPVLQRLQKEFAGRIRFAFKDYPLPMHPNAPKAAEATHCAGAQGKYWEYHDALFERKQFSPESLKSYAKDLKLDTSKFNACLDSGQMSGIVNTHAAEAQSLVLQGTPTFLVNGRLLTGDLSFEKIRAAILEELSAISAAQSVAKRSGGEQ